jgi:hypothetical protein
MRGLALCFVEFCEDSDGGGWAFQQLSCSDYFKGIHVVTGGMLSGSQDAVYIPLREFDAGALLLPSGRSMLSQLLTIARRLVIEDVDLLPCHLDDHIEQFALRDVRVTNLTEQARRRGSTIYLVERKSVFDPRRTNEIGRADLGYPQLEGSCGKRDKF